jgi:hypothetical protein
MERTHTDILKGLVSAGKSRICLRQSLIPRDVALDGLPTDTNSTGYLPLTQTINAMVMEDLFFLVHVYHVLTNYTITALF